MSAGIGPEPPWDELAEQTVLGAMMLAPHVIPDVESVLTGSDFYRHAHELIFAAIVSLEADGKPAEIGAVHDELVKRGDARTVGGVPYLHECLSNTTSAATVGHYARIVRERAVLRRLITAGMKVTQLGYATDGGNVDTIASAALQEITAAVEAGVRAPTGVNFADRLEDILLELDEPLPENAGTSWGCIDLNDSLNPMRAGQFIVVGARPGIGKSTFVRNVAVDAALRQGKRVLIHTFEMTRPEYEECIISAEARVPLANVIGHTMRLDDHARVGKIRDKVHGSILVIDDTRDLTLSGLRASVRRHKPDLLVVDQLHHIKPIDNGRRSGSRQEDIGGISRGLKTLAGLESCAVLACSKMNRESEKAPKPEDKRPTMAMLRDSGEIESDADTVIMLHREDAYNKESERAGEADFYVDKQRAGVQGVCITLAAQLHYARFVDMDEASKFTKRNRERSAGAATDRRVKD